MITFNMSLKQYIFLNVSTHALHLNEPFGVNMEHLCALFKEINEKQNPEDPRGWKKIPEESEDPQIVNPGVSKAEIRRGTPGFGAFKEPLAIPSRYQAWTKEVLVEYSFETSLSKSQIVKLKDSIKRSLAWTLSG